MIGIWSKNRYLDVIVNILLFLVSINFFHVGQLMLPIICLILFIDRGFKFRVNSIIIFIVLCLFAITFFVFSYKQGFYSVIGFCLPMAYYIGSNTNEVSESCIKNTILLIALGMMIHILLNICTDIVIKKDMMFYSSSHYDIWILNKVSTSTTSINYIFNFGILYYLIVYEKNKLYRIVFFIIFSLNMVYSIALGQRTIVLMLIISLLCSVFLDCIVYKKKKINLKSFKYVLYFIILAIAMLLIIKVLNKDVFQIGIENTRLFSKFLNKGFKTERFDVLINTIKLTPYYLFGGNEISNILGIMPHDLWFDVYDWGGIVPFLLLTIHTIDFIYIFIKCINNDSISKEFKIIVIPLFLCVGLQMMLEPIISGASIFLICVIIIESMIERLNKYAK